MRRSHRSKERAFLLEGRAAILDAVAAGANLRDLFAVPEESTQEVLDAADRAGVEVTEVAPQVLAALTETVTPQGVVGVADSPEVDLDELPAHPRLVLVLAGVNDPGNAGTLLRTAAAAGADGVVFSRGSVDPLNPKVVRASAAALFLVPLVRGPATTDVAHSLRSRGCALLGAEAGGKNVFTEVDLSVPLALFLGNEATGFAPDLRDFLDDVVAVPMPGRTESLNVGIAGSILLFEVVRQRIYR